MIWSNLTKKDGVVESVNVYAAKTHLSQLLTRVESGEEIIIARNGRPVARLTPVAASQANRRPGAWRGRVTIADDFDDFDAAANADWYGAKAAAGDSRPAVVACR